MKKFQRILILGFGAMMFAVPAPAQQSSGPKTDADVAGKPALIQPTNEIGSNPVRRESPVSEQPANQGYTGYTPGNQGYTGYSGYRGYTQTGGNSGKGAAGVSDWNNWNVGTHNWSESRSGK